MPGTHPMPKKKYGKYTNEQLSTALFEIENGSSIYHASKQTGVPEQTLRRTLNNNGKVVKPGNSTILSEREETAIAEWVKESGRRGFGKSPALVCEAVKQVLDKAGRRITAFQSNRPGKSWWYGFLRRHPDLHMLRPKPLELSRATACSQEKVYAWFDAYEEFLSEQNVTSIDQIYNCDESGFPLQATSSTKICIDRSMKRAFHLASSSKTSITTLHCISASGSVVPPAVYFPGKSLNPEYCLGFPKNFFIGFSDSGWMETYHFYAWVTNHFVKQIPPKRPVLLLIDGHVSHIDYDTTLFCKENGILLFRLPPHTSHVMQPADRGFFNVFKEEWKQACTRFTFANPGIVVTKRTFSRVFVEAFDRSARPDVVKASFKCSGIWPVNRYAIEMSAFAPAKTFEKIQPASATASMEEPTTSNEGPSTSTPKKPDERHPVIKSLEQLETVIEPMRLSLFQTRIEEGYDVEDDAIFTAWKVLKLKKDDIDREAAEGSISKSSLEEDLCPVIENILVYPKIIQKEKKQRKKVILPRHMTSESALKVLEVQDSEKRRKELVKEVKRRKKEERENAKRIEKESGVKKDQKSQKSQKKGKNEKSKKNLDQNSKKNEKSRKYKKDNGKSKDEGSPKQETNDENKENEEIGVTNKQGNKRSKRKKQNEYLENPNPKTKKLKVCCGECSLEYDDSETWVSCDSCLDWFHVSCTNLNYVDSEEIDAIDWSCINCQ